MQCYDLGFGRTEVGFAQWVFGCAGNVNSLATNFCLHL